MAGKPEVDLPRREIAGDAPEIAPLPQATSATPRPRASWFRRISRVFGRARSVPVRDVGEPLTVIPPLPPGHEQVSLTPLKDGLAYVRLTQDVASKTHHYEVIEPTLDEDEKRVQSFLRETLIATMDGHDAVDADDRRDYLLAAARQAILDHDVALDDLSVARVEYHLVRDFLGYGAIDVLMHDPMIEDISCDGPGVPIYIFHRSLESLRSNIVFPDARHLDLFVIRLAQRSGKQISIADPLLDATLPDKSRLQASLSGEITTRGSSFTIRKFKADPITPPELVRFGTMDARLASFFWLAMEAGNSMIMGGGTASGKTTTLNAISLFIPPQKKIVSIEDTRELNLPHENWVPGLTRSGFGGEVVGGKFVGAIDMYRLLEAALRQRPEYLIVGEVRGAEALTLFQAMATGHAAYSTMHADSVQSAVYRLENEPINVPRLMLQTIDAIVIQRLVRVEDKLVRRIMEVVEITGTDPETGDLLTNTVFKWDPSTDTYVWTGKSYIIDRIAQSRNLRLEDIEAEWALRARLINAMAERGIKNIRDVGEIIATYYNAPTETLARVESGGEPHANG